MRRSFRTRGWVVLIFQGDAPLGHPVRSPKQFLHSDTTRHSPSTSRPFPRYAPKGHRIPAKGETLERVQPWKSATLKKPPQHHRVLKERRIQVVCFGRSTPTPTGSFSAKGYHRRCDQHAQKYDEPFFTLMQHKRQPTSPFVAEAAYWCPIQATVPRDHAPSGIKEIFSHPDDRLTSPSQGSI